MIRGSAGHLGHAHPGIAFPRIPIVEPADLADTLWTMLTKRDRPEEILPPPAA